MSSNHSYALFSVRIAEKILGIDNLIEVVFKDPHYFSGIDISAVFIIEGYYIIFNNSFLANASLFDIMITGFHEVRHAYQYMHVQLYNEKVRKHNNEELYLINKWEKDFNRGRKRKEMSREEYLSGQTVVDAIAFSC